MSYRIHTNFQIPRLEPNVVDAFTTGTSETQAATYLPMEDDRSNLVSGFYEKCSQIANVEHSDVEVNDERILSFLEEPSSSQMDSSSYRVKDKKIRHKNCHKSKKHRAEGSKLRELSKGNLPESPDSMSVYNNSISNDFFKVSSINDVFVSSNTPECVVELETTPLEQLCRQDQLTIIRVDAPEKPIKLIEPTHADVTVQVRSNTDVADTSIRAIKEQIKIEPASLFIQVPSSQPFCRNYLASAVITDASTRASSEVPNSLNNYVSLSNVKSENSTFVAKPRIEEPKIKHFLNAPYADAVVLKGNTSPKANPKPVNTNSPIRKKSSK